MYIFLFRNVIIFVIKLESNLVFKMAFNLNLKEN